MGGWKSEASDWRDEERVEEADTEESFLVEFTLPGPAMEELVVESPTRETEMSGMEGRTEEQPETAAVQSTPWRLQTRTKVLLVCFKERYKMYVKISRN